MQNTSPAQLVRFSRQSKGTCTERPAQHIADYPQSQRAIGVLIFSVCCPDTSARCVITQREIRVVRLFLRVTGGAAKPACSA